MSFSPIAILSLSTLLSSERAKVRLVSFPSVASTLMGEGNLRLDCRTVGALIGR